MGVWVLGSSPRWHSSCSPLIEAEYLRAGAARDNRMAWAQILEDGFLEVNDKVTVVIPMTRIYLIALDSTCGVERDLGVVARAGRTCRPS